GLKPALQIHDVLRTRRIRVGVPSENRARCLAPSVSRVALGAVGSGHVPAAPTLGKWAAIVGGNRSCTLDAAGSVRYDGLKRQLGNESFRLLRVVADRTVVPRRAFEYGLPVIAATDHIEG